MKQIKVNSLQERGNSLKTKFLTPSSLLPPENFSEGFGGIFIIIGILMIAFLGFLFYIGFFNSQKPAALTLTPQPSAYKTLSDDPKYQAVKNKYNLNEEQLQVLSTVDPNDNE